MNRSEKISILAIVVALLSCTLVGLAWWDIRNKTAVLGQNISVAGSTNKGGTDNRPTTEWLKGTSEEKLAQVEKQLRGLDKTMVEVGYRFAELYFAGNEHNWDYAKYQLEKIETAVRLGLVRRPKRAKSAEPFLQELPSILPVIESGNDVDFLKAMERLRTSCMKCHTDEKVPYFTVEFPEQRLSPIRTVQ